MKLANCQHCNIEFKIKPGTKGMFCSNKCSYLFQRPKYEEQRQLITTKKKQEYLANPRLCGCGCGEAIPFEKPKNKFISQSHAATFNNTGTIQSLERIQLRNKTRKSHFYPSTRIYFNICKSCNAIFVNRVRRKTCSKQCYTENNSNNGAKLAAQNKNNFSTRVSNFTYRGTTINCDSKLECAAVIYLTEIKQATQIEKFRGILSFKDEVNRTRKFNPDIICMINGKTTIVEVKQVWNTTCNINSYNKYFNEKKASLEKYCCRNNYDSIWLDFNYDNKLKEIYRKFGTGTLEFESSLSDPQSDVLTANTKPA